MARYLTAVFLLGLVASVSHGLQAQTYNVLYNLMGAPDGALPYAGLFLDGTGNLYGTTNAGGSGTCYNGTNHGCGTVFKLDPSGNETVLHSFAGGSDGAYPWGSIIGDSAGNLYGTTLEGGAFGFGTVFKLDPTGNETILYSFPGSPDGANPYGALIRDEQGNLYGTTTLGGSTACRNTGSCGTVFEVDASGAESVLYSFVGGIDGQNPYGSLWRDSSGSLYGTTYGGGSSACDRGCGTVFKIDNGTESVLYRFRGGGDGSGPEAGVVGDSAGNLYGTTAIGGYKNCPGGCGIVFKVDSAGSESVLYRFRGETDGQLPDASLIRDVAGNLFGTTFGARGYASVFRLSAANTFKVLKFFGGGEGPYFSALVRDSAGNLYGTTMGGGGDACFGGCGTVFKISPP